AAVRGGALVEADGTCGALGGAGTVNVGLGPVAGTTNFDGAAAEAGGAGAFAAGETGAAGFVSTGAGGGAGRPGAVGAGCCLLMTSSCLASSLIRLLLIRPLFPPDCPAKSS